MNKYVLEHDFGIDKEKLCITKKLFLRNYYDLKTYVKKALSEVFGPLAKGNVVNVFAFAKVKVCFKRVK